MNRFIWLGIAVITCASAASLFLNRQNKFLKEITNAKTESEQLALVDELRQSNAIYQCILFDSLGQEVDAGGKPYWIVLAIEGDRSVLFAPKSERVTSIVLMDK